MSSPRYHYSPAGCDGHSQGLTSACVCVLQEFSGEDNSDLFREEAQAQLKAQQDQLFQARLAVPGILNPYEAPDDMADL